jgi:hypothetical protein
MRFIIDVSSKRSADSRTDSARVDDGASVRVDAWTGEAFSPRQALQNEPWPKTNGKWRLTRENKAASRGPLGACLDFVALL